MLYEFKELFEWLENFPREKLRFAFWLVWFEKKRRGWKWNLYLDSCRVRCFIFFIIIFNRSEFMKFIIFQTGLSCGTCFYGYISFSFFFCLLFERQDQLKGWVMFMIYPLTKKNNWNFFLTECFVQIKLFLFLFNWINDFCRAS